MAVLSQSGNTLTGSLSGGGYTSFTVLGSASSFFNIRFGVETFSNVWAAGDGDFYFSMALDTANPNRMVGTGGVYCSSATAVKR